MGRIGMPIMNKVGYSMYWNSMWDDKLNYSRAFKEDIFIKIFFRLFIEGGYNFIIRFNSKYSDDLIKDLKLKYDFQLIKKRVDERHFKYSFNYQEFDNTYISRIWILKYQTWVIFYFFTYSCDLGFFKKTEKIDKNIKHFNILFNYYHLLFKINYSYFLYNNNCINKYSF